MGSRLRINFWNTLRTLCRWAVRVGILMRNPVDGVEPPRFERKEMRALDPDGISELLTTARGTDLELPIAVAVGTGLRRGELLALRWSDIDLGEARLSVRRSIETIKGVTRSKPPKTARSARTISLPSFVVSALQRCRVDQQERRSILGLEHATGEDWVFTRADESVWEPGAFSLRFARLVKRAKLRHLRFHDLGHSFGTLALASGVDLKTLSSALGHSEISTTANVYLHVVESLRKDAAARIDAILGGVVGETLAANEALMPPAPPKASVPQRCHTKALPIAKARHIRTRFVAPTGVEPVSQP